MPVPYLACMLATAHFYALPPRVLPTIQAVEGGKPGLVHPNTDGSADLGLMQINTLWLRPIAEVVRQPPAIVARRLLGDPCFSIAAAGAILRTYMNETHGQLMLAIGDYHSHTPVLNQTYQALVMAKAAALFGPG
jgi:soluble lytic murein transglycosylase-like protein